MGLAGLPLALASPGEQVEVVAVAAKPEMRRRLCDLGVIAGKTLRVVQKTGASPMVIALGDTRFALDPSMARTVLVTPSQNKESTGNDLETQGTCGRRPCRGRWFR